MILIALLLYAGAFAELRKSKMDVRLLLASVLVTLVAALYSGGV